MVGAARCPASSASWRPNFAGFDLDITDVKRFDAWLPEFASYVANGNLPQLSIIHLPNDHTAGRTPGTPTPRAMVGENDFALGRIVEPCRTASTGRTPPSSCSKTMRRADRTTWTRTGRSCCASPFAKRGFVDHTFYTTSGVLRTIELILGLQPMSQYDAAATPLYNAFNGTPNLAPYRRSTPTSRSTRRTRRPRSARRSRCAMDFSDADRTPEALLNEILWRSVRKGDAPMPPPRRSVFVARATADADRLHGRPTITDSSESVRVRVIW